MVRSLNIKRQCIYFCIIVERDKKNHARHALGDTYLMVSEAHKMISLIAHAIANMLAMSAGTSMLLNLHLAQSLFSFGCSSSQTMLPTIVPRDMPIAMPINIVLVIIIFIL